MFISKFEDVSTTIVKSDTDLANLLTFIDSKNLLSFDIETNSAKPDSGTIVGFGISSGLTGFYVPVFRYDTELKQLVPVTDLNTINLILSRMDGKNLIAWNGGFESRFCAAYFKWKFIDSFHADSMLMLHTADENRFSYGLKENAEAELGSLAVVSQKAMLESMKANGGKSYEYYKASTESLGIYCIWDCVLTEWFYHKYAKVLKSEGTVDFFFTEVMELYKHVTIPMEANGIKLDMPKLLSAQNEIEQDLAKLNEKIQAQIAPNLSVFTEWFLNKDFPPARTGAFAQGIAEFYDLPLPRTGAGAYSLSKKALEALPDSTAKSILLQQTLIPKEDIVKIQQLLWSKTGAKYMFNLLSKHHLKKLFFDTLGEQPLSRTELGSPQVDDDFLTLMSQKYDWCSDLTIYNRLTKIKGTYIDRFLDAQVDGRFYPSFQQHRTISGRYGGDLQQLPRPVEAGSDAEVVLKYNNQIREFFIADDGYVFVDDDYESAEPRTFAHISGEQAIKDIFIDGEDFYSKIAILIEGLDQYSANKKAPNYLGKLDKAKRQAAKSYCFTKDTLVLTPDGEVPIQTLKVGDLVITRDGPKKILKTFIRSADTIKVHTNRGILECTTDHQIFANGKWTEAASLLKGDLLEESGFMVSKSKDIELPIRSNMSFKNGCTKPIGYLKLDEEWSYYIGATIGDGVISINQTPNLYGHGLKGYVGICGDPKDMVVDKISSFCASIGFPLTTKRVKGNCEIKAAINSELCKIVYDTLQLGDMNAKHKCKNLKVPDYMFQAPMQYKLAFLAGLFDTDGHVAQNHNTVCASITSKDFRLMNGISRLLKSMGIQAVQYQDWNKLYKKFYYSLRLPVTEMEKLKHMNIQQYMIVDRKRKSFAEIVVKQRKKPKPPMVVYVEDVVLTKQVYDIKVEDSPEFYANGLLVHNCLGIPYGMSGYKLSFELGISVEEAEGLIKKYLDSFPNLKEWMTRTEQQVKLTGKVKSETGRIRHMPRAAALYSKHGDRILDSLNVWKDYHHSPDLYAKMKQIRRELRNYIANGNNFQIQSRVASMMNLACIAIAKEFKRLGLDAKIVAQIHDELIVHCAENIKEQVAEIIKYGMESAAPCSVPMVAIPSFGKNFREAKGA